jgi:hypothetical protein
VTSVDVPQWALFDQDNKEFIIREESGNLIFQDFELNTKEDDQID